MGAQKNSLIETVLLSTNNIMFGWELRKLFFYGTHSELKAWVYSKTCPKRPLKNIQNTDRNDKW